MTYPYCLLFSVFAPATSSRLIRPLLISSRIFPHQTSPSKNDHLHRMQPAHLPHTLLMTSGFDLFCVLAQRAVPSMRFVFLGSRFCLRLPSNPVSPQRSCRSANGSGHHGPQRTFTSK